MPDPAERLLRESDVSAASGCLHRWYLDCHGARFCWREDADVRLEAQGHRRNDSERSTRFGLGVVGRGLHWLIRQYDRLTSYLEDLFN